MGIGTKLLIAFLLIGLIPLSLLGGLTVKDASEGLSSQSYANLAAIAEYKTQTMESWLEDRINDVHLVPLTAFYQNAAKQLQSGDPGQIKQAQEATLRGLNSIKNYTMIITR